MQKSCLLIVFILLTTLATGGAAAQPVEKEVYTSYCSGCHGQDGTGLTMDAPDFSAESFWDNRTRQGVLSRVRYGVPGSEMPPWGNQLSEEQMRAALRHAADFAGVELESLPEGTPYPKPTRGSPGPGTLLGIAALTGAVWLAGRR